MLTSLTALCQEHAYANDLVLGARREVFTIGTPRDTADVKVAVVLCTVVDQDAG